MTAAEFKDAYTSVVEMFGDHVEITAVINGTSITVQGIIMKIVGDSVGIRTDDGKYRSLGVSSILFIDPIFASAGNEFPGKENQKTETSNSSADFFPSSIVSQSAPSSAKSAVLPRPIVSIAEHQEYSFDLNKQILSLNTELKNGGSRDFYHEINGIINSLQDACKNRSVLEKYPVLNQKLHKLWAEEKCESPVDYQGIYTLWGLLAMAAEKYDAAFEPFVRAKKFALAAHAATMSGNQEKSDIFYVCALLQRDPTVQIDQYLVDLCYRRQDVSFLPLLLEKCQDEAALCEQLVSCAYALCKKNDNIPNLLANDATNQALELCLGKLPHTWREKNVFQDSWKEYSSYNYPLREVAQENVEDELTGYIRIFRAAQGQKWGFIGQYYFHISQVFDETDADVLLRQLLLSNQGIDLEVKFYLGRSRRIGRETSPVATDIMLSEKGAAEAWRRRENPQFEAKILEGIIVSYNVEKGKGYLLSGTKQLGFDLISVRDPYLRAYLTNSFEVSDQDVTYTLGWEGAQKRCAVDICWASPREDLKDAFAPYVGNEDRRMWESFCEQREAETDSFGLVSEDQALQDPFSPLELWEEQDSGVLSAFTWSVPEKQPGTTVNKSLPPAASVLPVPHIGPADSFSNGSKATIERNLGHRCMNEGKLDAAEKHLLNALEYGFQPIEALVGDLVMIYLRQPEKLSQAEELLEQYKNYLSRSKLLNLRISVFDKMKKGEELCALYEEALRNDTTTAQKSHHLYCLITTYIRITKYPEALQVCQRWEQLFNQNRYTAGWEKLKSFSSNINRQKAIALYHTGKKAEAKQIATDLVRLNPADTTANAILNETLVEVDTILATENVYLAEAIPDDENDFDSKIPGLIRHQIDSLEISNFLKSRVKNGRYQGTTNQAKNDINALLGTNRNAAPKQRSDRLLVACKILDQVGQVSSTRYNQYCGRAMASWGDYMVAQSSQLDTPRMAYLYSIRLLLDNRAEQNWVDSYNRYLKSYFIGQAQLDEYIGKQNKSREKEPANTDIFATGSIPDFLVTEFFVGILQLLNSLSDQQNGRNDCFKQLILDLYGKSAELRQSICRQVQLFLNIHVDSPSKEQFDEALRKACIHMNKQLENLVGEVETASKNILDTILPLRPLDEKWKTILSATDWKRLQNIWSILQGAGNYPRITDFDSRAECLRSAIAKVNDLLRDIANEPTELSYDKFRPVLEAMLDHLTEEHQALYEKFGPELTWEDRMQHHRSPDGSVMIYLLLSNRTGLQTADIQNIGVKGPDITSAKVSTLDFSLRGGDEKEIIITLHVKGDADKTGSISATLGCKYTFSTANHTVTEQTVTHDLTFVIRSEKFVPLKNPFKNHIGSAMEDEKMFRGRDVEIDQLVEKLCPDGNTMNYGQGIAIYGQTRCGKSSLLFHLKKRLKQRYGNKLLVWDMDNVGDILAEDDTETDSYMGNFLYTMLDIGESAVREHPVLGAIARKEGLLAPLDKMESEPQRSLLLFNSYMRKLNAIVQEQECMIVIFVDEFTYLHELIKSGKLSSNFMKFWKAFLQNNCVYAVVAGQDDMPEFMQEYQNEFAAMDILKLTYLGESPAKELFRCSLEAANGRKDIIWPDRCEDSIYELTAGSAYLTLLFCSDLVNFLNIKGASMVTQGILESFLKEKVFHPTETFLRPLHFEPQLKERGHGEYDAMTRKLLDAIAKLSKTTEIPDISQVDLVDDDGLPIDPSQVHEIAERLAERDVLIRKGTNQYSIQVKLLQQWLLFEMRE